MPKFLSPRIAKTTIDPPIIASERRAAIQRLPRKSNFLFGIKSSMESFFNPNLSISHRNAVRVKSRAENIEAMMPSVRVTAKPFTEPVACQKGSRR